MSKNKKLLTSGVALVTAAALTLGGTFAWQSISQGAVNEASDVVNPGGRLHNDQHWVSDLENDTNIYVENFIEKGKGDDIYARVRLSEYMEVVMNYGTKAEVVDVVAGSKTLKDGVTEDEDGNTLTDDSATRQNKFDYEYAVHDFAKDFDDDDETKNPTSDFFTWTEGKEDADRPYFMPTFNKNKDSVAADLNGEYADTLGGISNREKDQYDYEEITADTEAVTASAIYDTDSDKDDELKSLSYSDLKMLYETGGKMQNTTVQAAIDNKDIQLVEETHEVTQVGETKGLISMSAWLEKAKTEGYKDEKGALTDEGKTNLYGYWVYDEDGSGWVYWSAPIAAGETTGLLLDGFKLNGVMDDTWYYAIDVEAQFVTANDVGSVEDNDGFYHIVETASVIDLEDTDSDETATTTPKAVSENAETLLKLIGVQIADTTTGDDADDGKDDNNEVPDTDYKLNLKTTEGSSNIVSFVSVKPDETILLDNGKDSGDYTIVWLKINPDNGRTANVTLTKDTDYTLENGVLTIKENNDMSGGSVLLVKNADSTKSGYIVVNDDAEIKCTGSGQSVVDGTVIHKGSKVNFTNNDKGEISFNPTYGATADTEYTFSNNVFEWLIDGDEGRLLLAQTEGPQGYLFVESATDGDVSGEGGQTDTDNPTEDDTAVEDWSSKVKLRNITSDEYGKLCDVTNESNDLMHWKQIYSITDTVHNGNASSRVLHGYTSARDSADERVTTRHTGYGWRAAFESLTPDTDCADLSVGDVVVMGTLYVGDDAIKVPTNPDYDGDVTAYDKDGSGVTSKITLGKALSDENYQMKAVYVGDGLFICDRCVLNYISWNQINAALTPAEE